MTAWTAPLLVVGHRGGRKTKDELGDGAAAWPPENTLAAFERARSEGARAVELDARPCADGEAVVFHDPTLTRMTRSMDTRSVHDVSRSALRALDLGGGAGVPALVDVLHWAAESGIAVNVEMKHDVPSRIESVRAVARALRHVRGDVLLSSFDPVLLAIARVMAPSVPRALLTHAGQPLWADIVEAVARPPLVQALHLENTQIAPGVVTRCLRRGLRVGVWTVNDPDEARALVRQGVATIITDAAGELSRHLSP